MLTPKAKFTLLLDSRGLKKFRSNLILIILMGIANPH